MEKSKQDENIVEAKKSLKSHIKFLECLIKHIGGDDEVLKGRAMWAAWCLHRYINDGMIKDIEQAMRAFKASNDPVN